MSAEPLYLGLDIGTSGARALIVDDAARIQASGKAAMAEFGENHRDPGIWWQAAQSAVRQGLAQVDKTRIAALCIDGTSGTMLPVDASGTPLASAFMYNDPCKDTEILNRIADHAPDTSAAHGPTSGTAKALIFAQSAPDRILHQADWIASRFSARFVSDANNALKTGFDPVAGCWPKWMEAAGLDISLLPEVLEPGETVGTLTSEACAEFGLPKTTRVVAGTTDGCASFLATGASQVGDGVTALGTTLTLKLLSDKPIFAPQYGIYSHRILGMWLAGGASNSGGNVLLAHFTPEEMAALTPLIDPEIPSGLNYYPLVRPGERFPIADPELPPRIEPRPPLAQDFLKALFEGMAAVEKLGYDRMAELGAPALRSVRSVGGGAANPAWTKIRSMHLGVDMAEPASNEAAFGAALLARGSQ